MLGAKSEMHRDPLEDTIHYDTFLAKPVCTPDAPHAGSKGPLTRPKAKGDDPNPMLARQKAATHGMSKIVLFCGCNARVLW